MDVFETVNNTQILVATNWTGMKAGTLEQEVTLGAWGLLPDSDYIISVRAKNEKVSILISALLLVSADFFKIEK